MTEQNELFHELKVHQIELEIQNEELQHAQVALESSRGRYMQLYHNAPVGYVVVDRWGIILEVNAVFARLTGNENAQITGKPFAEYLIPEDQAIFRARWKSFFKNPGQKQLDMRLSLADGKTRHVSLSAVVYRTRGQVSAEESGQLLVIVADIDARVKAEKAIEASRAYVSAIIDSLPAHVCVLDEDGMILTVNGSWRSFARENAEQITGLCEGTNYLEVCENVSGPDSEYARSFVAGVGSILRGEAETFRLEYPCHGPDEQRWFLCKVNLLNYGEEKRLVVVHINITDRVRLERQHVELQAKAGKLEKAASLNRMAGAVAHIFNNMLTTILGNLEIALEEVAEESSAGHYIQEATQSVLRASEPSNLLLTYLGQHIVEKTRRDLAQICRQGLPILLRIKPAKVKITADFPARGSVVYADARQIQQVLANLVTNAWEAMAGGQGQVVIAMDTVAATDIAERWRFPQDWQPAARRYACLTVADNGCGIEEEKWDKLFDPFFSDKFTGRGMGLPVVQGILQAHDGGGTIASERGKGTTVRVYLPLAEEDKDSQG